MAWDEDHPGRGFRRALLHSWMWGAKVWADDQNDHSVIGCVMVEVGPHADSGYVFFDHRTAHQ